MTRPSDRPRPTIRETVSPDRALADRIRALDRTPAQIRAWAEQHGIPVPKAGVDDLVLAEYEAAHPASAGVARAKTAAARPAAKPKPTQPHAVPVDGTDEVILWPHPNRPAAAAHPEEFEPFPDEPPTDAASAPGQQTAQQPPQESPSSTSTSPAPAAATPSTSTTSTATATSPSAPAGSSTASASMTSAPAADQPPTDTEIHTALAALSRPTTTPTTSPARPAAQALAAARRLGATGVSLHRYVARIVELDEHLTATLALARPANCTACGKQVAAEHIARTGHTVHGNPDTLTGCWPALTGRKTA